jgi:hypothetical protein
MDYNRHVQPETQKVVDQLRAFRAQGLSYYQAVQRLQASHVSQTVLDDASNVYDYQEDTIRSAQAHEPKPVQLAGGATAEQYAHTLLAADRLQARDAEVDKRRQQQPRPLPRSVGFGRSPMVPTYVRSWWPLILLLLLPLAFFVYLVKFK